MTHIENNVAIALFMGMDLHENEKDRLIDGSQGYNTSIMADELSYHTDWNELMKVVYKIESMGFEVQQMQNRCKISYCNDSSTDSIVEVDLVEGDKQDAILVAIKQFLEWHKEQVNICYHFICSVDNPPWSCANNTFSLDEYGAVTKILDLCKEKGMEYDLSIEERDCRGTILNSIYIKQTNWINL